VTRPEIYTLDTLTTGVSFLMIGIYLAVVIWLHRES